MTNTPVRIVCVLNRGSGSGTADTAERRVRERCAAAGCAVHFIHLDAGSDLAGELSRALETPAQAVVAAGGDGTVNGVASAILDRGIPLGVLPLGTLNHFASDLALPDDLDAAIDVILGGQTTMVDVGEVNGHIFLNNSSLGLYARIVQLRERYQARGVTKWLVAVWATLGVTRGSSAFRVRITAEGRDVVRRTPLVFIGNNAYRMAGIDAGSRASLTDGALAVYVVKTDGRPGLMRLVWRILAGTAVGSDELALLRVQRATIDVPHRAQASTTAIAIDGEVTRVTLPLEYVMRPRALSVCVSARSVV